MRVLSEDILNRKWQENALKALDSVLRSGIPLRGQRHLGPAGLDAPIRLEEQLVRFPRSEILIPLDRIDLVDARGQTIADFYRVQVCQTALEERLRERYLPAAPANAVGKKPSARRHKSSPQLESAQRAIEELYPRGVPDRDTLPDPILYQKVAAKIKEADRTNVSNTTILRAAGRRKSGK
jgi:hypothetical protein